MAIRYWQGQPVNPWFVGWLIANPGVMEMVRRGVLPLDVASAMFQQQHRNPFAPDIWGALAGFQRFGINPIVPIPPIGQATMTGVIPTPESMMVAPPAAFTSAPPAVPPIAPTLSTGGTGPYMTTPAMIPPPVYTQTFATTGTQQAASPLPPVPQLPPPTYRVYPERGRGIGPMIPA